MSSIVHYISEGTDEELYLNPDHIESITITRTMVHIKCASGTIYNLPNEIHIIKNLERCDILPED